MITNSDTDHNEADLVAEEAATAAEAIRTLNHMTLGQTLPGPDAFRIIAQLVPIGHRLPQLLDQLGRGLVRSLDEFDISEDDGTDPTHNVHVALAHLQIASQHAIRLGRALDRAQNAIAGQSYRASHEPGSD